MVQLWLTGFLRIKLIFLKINRLSKTRPVYPAIRVAGFYNERGELIISSVLGACLMPDAIFPDSLRRWTGCRLNVLRPPLSADFLLA